MHSLHRRLPSLLAVLRQIRQVFHMLTLEWWDHFCTKWDFGGESTQLCWTHKHCVRLVNPSDYLWNLHLKGDGIANLTFLQNHSNMTSWQLRCNALSQKNLNSSDCFGIPRNCLPKMFWSFSRNALTLEVCSPKLFHWCMFWLYSESFQIARIDILNLFCRNIVLEAKTPRLLHIFQGTCWFHKVGKNQILTSSINQEKLLCHKCKQCWNKPHLNSNSSLALYLSKCDSDSIFSCWVSQELNHK